MLVMLALGGLAFCIGLGFFLLGAWPVVGFLGLELLVVWGAFKLNYRAAKQRQTLTATANYLVIENISAAGNTNRTDMPTAWLRVEITPRDVPEASARYCQRLFVTSHGRRTEIGAFLHPAETPVLATELSAMLDRAHIARLNMTDKTPA